LPACCAAGFRRQQVCKLAADREAQAVPPYLRLVPASACWNASKMIFCFSSGMPMPVSDTSKAMTPATG
jgi:hypothetical protein